MGVIDGGGLDGMSQRFLNERFVGEYGKQTSVCHVAFLSLAAYCITVLRGRHFLP